VSKNNRILVTGASGFIGHHLVKRLRAQGNWVRGSDLKAPEYESTHANEFEVLNLRKFENTLLSVRGGINQVYNLAADMGGIGFITGNHTEVARNNSLLRWEPSIPFESGLDITYAWIEGELAKEARTQREVAAQL
jgi:nucleoside-diphosphate-sugar epimerase